VSRAWLSLDERELPDPARVASDIDFAVIDSIRARNCKGRPLRSLDLVAAACERAFGVSAEEIVGRSREKYIAQARHAFIWTLRQATPWSMPAIAARVGQRDHSTILNSLKKAEARRRHDLHFRLLTDAMVEAVRAGLNSLDGKDTCNAG
jgi:chromosomal replication initiation ATPase DnaA